MGWGIRLLRVLSLALLIAMGASTLVVAVLAWTPPPTSAFMILRQLQAPATGAVEIRYEWVPYDHISPHMALAAVAGEDQRFPEHRGFDLQAIRKALRHNAQGGSVRGASTISQQVAKNLFLWPGRSYVRKGLEAWFTVLIELLWSKQRILEVYLNVAEFGHHTFGVGAASWRYFQRPPAALGPEQAALLAAVLPNPLEYRVDSPSARVRERQRWILRQMRQLGGPAYLGNL